MVSILILQLKHRLLLLIFLKVFKNISMETDYFTKMFYLKKRIVMHTEWTTNVLGWPKNISENISKLIEKRIENNQKKAILIKLWKKRVLYENWVHFIEFRTYLRHFMHAIVAFMSALFKNSKRFSYFLHIFEHSCLFLKNVALLFMPYNMHCSPIITYKFCMIKLFILTCIINCILRSRSNKVPFP